jgi:hypothetical protein
MVRKDGAPRRRLAGTRLAPALAIVLALGAIRADRALGEESYPDRGEGRGTRMTLKEAFDILDANHDGVVTRHEFLVKKVEVSISSSRKWVWTSTWTPRTSRSRPKRSPKPT